MNKDICIRKENNSCLNDSDIETFIEIYNKYNNIKITDKKHYLEKMGGDYEWEIMKLDIYKNDKKFYNKLKKVIFKPIIQKYALLTNFDIDDVMSRINNVDFLWNGVYACDFYNYIETLEFKKILKRMNSRKQTAIILNTDSYTQNGSHWVCVFIDNYLKTIEFYDSFGKPPNVCVKVFINALKKYNTSYEYVENQKQQQKENIECGIYCIRYIIERIHGTDSFKLMNQDINDKQANIWRKNVFITSRVKI